MRSQGSSPGRRQHGFTLIELMIALVIGSLLVSGLLAIFIYGNRSYREDDQVAKMQDELRFAMSQITRDLEMAGFWASLLDPAQITLDSGLTITGDCGPAPILTGAAALEPAGSPKRTWVYGSVGAVAILNDGTAAQTNSAFPCIEASEVGSGLSDVVAVRRLASEVSYEVLMGAIDGLETGTAPAEMVPGSVYVQTNGQVGDLFELGVGPSSGLAPPYEYWRFRPTIYYIRAFTDQPGDGVPSLCRKLLTAGAGGPTLSGENSTECLATGIEDLQMEYGIDRDGDAAPDYYVSDPPADELALAVAVRVTLLARSERPGQGYVNPKTYFLTPEKTFTPDDRFYRRTLTTTVLLRNPAALRTY